jgi:hypothetical protein
MKQNLKNIANFRDKICEVEQIFKKILKQLRKSGLIQGKNEQMVSLCKSYVLTYILIKIGSKNISTIFQKFY